MQGTSQTSGRVAWLDGLRGLAAMQVVLLHYVQAFLPAVASFYPRPLTQDGWESLALAPLGYLFDGSSAVYLFFIISGVVLTQAFTAGSGGFLPIVIRRAIRLGLPMAAATLIAGALFFSLPDAHVLAGGQTGSAWFQYVGPRTISVASIAHNIVFEGLLAGFYPYSLVPPWLSGHLHMSDVEHSYNPPLWTMHIEFCGSLLVAFLVMVRKSASRAAHVASCVVLGAAFVLSPLVLFIIGHILADRLLMAGGKAWQAILGSGLMASGIMLCTVQSVSPIEMLWHILPPPPLGAQGDVAILQRMIGAVLIFGGMVFLPVVQRQLQRSVPTWLGKVSFSMYLVHFPLAFTVVAAFFHVLTTFVPIGASVAVTSVIGISGSLLLAIVFERWVDRPAIMLSRMSDRSRKRRLAPTSVMAGASGR